MFYVAQALEAGLGQTELLQQQVQRSGLLSSESMKDRLGESMTIPFCVLSCWSLAWHNC
jgi:hypothetical protein